VLDAKHMTTSRTFEFEEQADVERLVKVGHDTMIEVMFSMTRTKWGVVHSVALASLTLKLANFELWLATIPCSV